MSTTCVTCNRVLNDGNANTYGECAECAEAMKGRRYARPDDPPVVINTIKWSPAPKIWLWDPFKDGKLNELQRLVTERYKVIPPESES